MSNSFEEDILSSMRKSYKYSKEKQGISRKLLITIVVISIVNSFIDGFNLVSIEILLAVSTIITIVSIVAVYFERESNQYRKNGDKARHLLFFNGLISNDIIKNEFQDISDKLIGKDIIVDKMVISDYYHHDVKGVNPQKALNLYESIFYEYKKRIYFGRKNQFRHHGMWILLFLIVLLGLILSSDNIGRLIASGLTIVILSPLAIGSIYLMIEWQNDIEELKKILNEVENVINIEELIFWFLEYTLIVGNVPFIPDPFYEEYHQNIKDEYTKITKTIDKKIVSNWS